MQRTNIIELKPNKKQEKILKECLLLSSCVYNSANYIVRQQFFAKEKVSNFRELQQKMQNMEDYKLLGRSYSLPRLQIYGETNSARFKLIKSKSQKQVGLPKYLKNRKTNTTIPSYLVIDNSQYCVKTNKVTIPLSRKMRKKYDVKHFDINYNGILKHKGKQQRGQIHFKHGKFYLYQSVEMETKAIKELKYTKRKLEKTTCAGLDIGQKNFLALVTNTNQELKIGSKRFYKQWKYYTDLIAIEQTELSFINRYSSNNLNKLFDDRKTYQENLFNNIVSKMMRFLKRNHVSLLFIGDIKNIRDGNDKGKVLNQMTHNYWSFAILLNKILNKCEEYCIKVKMVTEEYTSQTCPICYHCSENNKQDRIFLCEYCGYIEHRDYVGAWNIMVKGMHDLVGDNRSVHWCETAPLRGCSNATA